jgi:uncharacterized HAD superfamily protein
MESIAFDLDGVLYPWDEALYTYYRVYKGYTGTQYEFSFALNTFPEEELEYLCTISHIYEAITPDKKLLISLNNIAKRYNIFYITARPECARKATEDYLKNYRFPFSENLILTKSKGIIARLLNLTYFVDDREFYVEDAAKVSTAFLFERPWNIDKREGLNTIRSIQELERIIL